MITSHKLHKHSSEQMPEVDDNSVHLGVTSPPYNANKPYGQNNRLDPMGQEISRDKNSDSDPWGIYISKMRSVTSEMFRVLVPGGRFCVNVGDWGRHRINDNGTEYNLIPLHMLWWLIGVQTGFIFEGIIIWNKKNGENSGSHGSWRKYTRPIIQDVHEYILVFAKPNEDGKPIMASDHPNYTTMSKEEFLRYRKSVWTFNTRSHNNHPAVFPEELPRRLIEFFTGPGHIVLDPFAGTGTTAAVAKELNRNSISYEIEEEYWTIIEDITLQRSIEEWFLQQPTPAAGSE